MENNVKPRGLKLKTALRRTKDICLRLASPGELSGYLGVLRHNHSQLRLLKNLFPYDPRIKEEKNCIFGNFAELHERVSLRKGSFSGTTELLKAEFSVDPAVSCRIGVSRYNFFCLERIVNFVLELKGMPNARLIPFDVFPLRRIIPNFIVYASGVKKIAGDSGIELVLADDKLIEILQLVQFHAQRGKVSENGLARLFGVIAEQAFIGPQTIVLDPFHRCNLRCRHCFVHNPAIKHSEEFLERKFDYEMFKRVIDDAAGLKSEGIILQGDGEPLLYDKFFPMVEYARRKKLEVSFFTNGSLLGRQAAEDAVRLGVNQIYCSLPAGTAETYALVTATGTQEMFAATIDNLQRLIRTRKGKKGGKPRLIMTHVIHALNCRELKAMAETDARIGADAARFYLIRLDKNNRSLQLKTEDLEAIKRDLPACRGIFKRNSIEFIDNIFFQLGHYDQDTGAWSKGIFSREGCTIGWYFCLIPARYDVSMCCHLRTTGDLNRQSFRELWNSREYRDYRVKAKHLKDNADFIFPNGARLYDEHCEHCDNHQTLLSNLRELRRLELYEFLRG